MSTAIQRRRGTTAQHASFAGLNGELTVDTDKKTVVVHDGATAGGFPLARQDFSNVSSLALPAGAAATPVYSFTGDLNTGIYSPGADQLAISTGGSGRLFVDANGRVAAGGTPVAYQLEARVSGNNGFSINNSGNTGSDFSVLDFTQASSQRAVFYTNSGNLTTNVVSGTYRFQIGSAELMRLTSTGLGVGSSSPLAKLDISGNTDTYAGMAKIYLTDVNSNTASRNWSIGNGGSGHGNLTFSVSAAQNGNAGDATSLPRMVITSAGAVGIGTSSPTSAKLDVRDDVNYPIRWGSTSAQFGELSYDTGNCVIGATSGNKLTLRSAGTAAITIDTSQRVGIGTTTPSQPLEVVTASGGGIALRPSTGNATQGLLFYDTASGPWGFVKYDHQLSALSFGTVNSERARIDASGRLLVGTSTNNSSFNSAIQIAGSSTGATQLISRFDNNTGGPNLYFAKSRSGSVGTNTIVQSGDEVAVLGFYAADGANYVSAAEIRVDVDGTPGTNDMPGRLVFSVTSDGASSPTEAMRISQDRGVFIGGPNGSMASSGGYLYVQKQSDTVAYFNRNTNDGEIVQFRQDNNGEGSISVSGTTVSYNGAHLSRWSQLPGGAEREEILRGSVLSNIDEMCEWGDEENEQLNRMKVSDVEGDKNVSGVFQAWDDDDDTYINDFYCAMTGDFIIRIGAGVTVERGDLLMSAGDGTAKPQDDDIIRSKTIAKVTSTNVSCTYDDGSYCVPCVLMAC